jgi:tetratricopeptide (TPR) repeat protein
MKKYIIVVISLIFALNINAQTAKEVFNSVFPELNGALKPVESNKVTKDNIDLFRAQYKKLITASKEIEMFKFNGFPVTGGEVFKDDKALKSLQKDGTLTELETIINENILAMKSFLSDKHQWGADSVECIQNYSNLKMRLKQKDYKTACTYWRDLILYYPRSFTGVYTYGDQLIRQRIQLVNNEAAKVGKSALEANKAGKKDEAFKLAGMQKELVAEKELWIDTLLMIYDKRIKYFGNDESNGEGYLIGKKGLYIYEYRKDSALNEAYKLLEQSVLMEKEMSQYIIVKTFFDASMDMTKSEKIGAEKLVNDYNVSTSFLKEGSEKLVVYIEKESKKSKPNQENIENWEKIISNNEKASNYITSKFASSEFSKCEYLVPAFSKHFEENKTNTDWLEKVLGILKWKECTDDPFFGNAAKELYKLKPSPTSAAIIAIDALKKEQYDEASKYFEEAYNGETDNAKKAEYYYYAAVVAFAQNKKSNSRTLALKAAELKPDYGKAYILIAKVYASSAGSCGDNPYDKATVYWAAVDKLYKAKSVTNDTDVTDEANDLIGKYSSRFPNQEEGFMRGIYKDNTYTVGCWINEVTTVRY